MVWKRGCRAAHFSTSSERNYLCLADELTEISVIDAGGEIVALYPLKMVASTGNWVFRSTATEKHYIMTIIEHHLEQNILVSINENEARKNRDFKAVYLNTVLELLLSEENRIPIFRSRHTVSSKNIVARDFLFVFLLYDNSYQITQCKLWLTKI